MVYSRPLVNGPKQLTSSNPYGAGCTPGLHETLFCSMEKYVGCSGILFSLFNTPSVIDELSQFMIVIL